MERIIKRLNLFTQAITSLKVSLDKFTNLQPHDFYYDEVRDSIIQRFEYSIDAFWKLLKEYLDVKHGVESLGSPKLVIKTCFDINLISLKEYEVLTKMINDRNMTSHAYNELLAREIANTIPIYYDVMQLIATRISNTEN